MHPEDRLDALLSLRVEHGRREAEPPATSGLHGQNGYDGIDGLQPLLDVADRLSELGSVEPSPDFAARLKVQFFARVEYLDERDGASRMPFGDGSAMRFPGEMAPLLEDDDPTQPGLEWAAARDDATQVDAMPEWRPYARARRRTVWRRMLWPVLAATLLLAIGMTTLTAAAAAGPGTPLYGLHRWEQSLQVSLASGAASRTQLHLGYAQDALTALDGATTRHETDATYDDALATFSDEMRAAAVNLGAVPAGAERDTLSARLDQLRAQGRADLHNALAILPWPQRVTTTTTLAEIGDNILHVTQASMVYSGHGQHLWQITISGSGFQQGATLLVNGQPAGNVVSITSTTLVAQMSGDDSARPPDNIGVANPDNTAALTTNLSSDDQEGNGTPDAQQTPGNGDDHGGDRNDGTPGSSGTPGSGAGGH